jgi:hypothetical protein
MFRLFVAGKAGWGFLFMNITTVFKARNLKHEGCLEMEFFQYEEIQVYRLKIMRQEKYKWEVKHSIEITKEEAEQVLNYLKLTLKID